MKMGDKEAPKIALVDALTPPPRPPFCSRRHPKNSTKSNSPAQHKRTGGSGSRRSAGRTGQRQCWRKRQPRRLPQRQRSAFGASALSTTCAASTRTWERPILLLLVVQSQGLQRGKSIVGGKEGSATGDFFFPSVLGGEESERPEGEKTHSKKKIAALSRNKH